MMLENDLRLSFLYLSSVDSALQLQPIKCKHFCAKMNLSVASSTFHNDITTEMKKFVTIRKEPEHASTFGLHTSPPNTLISANSSNDKRGFVYSYAMRLIKTHTASESLPSGTSSPWQNKVWYGQSRISPQIAGC